jgi:DNA-binding transcriptional ArsR family regulator
LESLHEEINYGALADHLKVVSLPNRLQLLSILRKPHTLQEIRLTPADSQAGDSPDRPITRQAVQNHLGQLMEAGLLRVQKTRRDSGRPVQEYTVDHARLYGLLEELRKICTIRPFDFLDPNETIVMDPEPAMSWGTGPKIVVAHGLNEGTAMPLRDRDVREPRGWIIGRDEDAQIQLDYDPYVSKEHAEIVRDDGGFAVIDLRTAKNGTFVNWGRLPVGGQRRLKPGDVVGVGRSLLVFQPE